MKNVELMHDEWALLLEEYFFTKQLRPATEWSYSVVVN
ncbi:Uncharacterised protein [Serratia ficaria]|nr:Uncharacterised protein [Serratia ficaria]